MTASSLYNIPMSDKAFYEVKAGAIELWSTYDDTYGYVTKKLEKIAPLENVGDNGMFIIAMFDGQNKMKLLKELSEDTRNEIFKRLPEGYFVNEFLFAIGLENSHLPDES